jgi:acetyl-CoA C-acetyltransferase
MQQARHVVIVAARRTPQGRMLGALAKLSAVQLAAEAARAAIAGIDGERIDQVVVGQVITAGTGWCAGRQLVVQLGLPIATPGYSVNMACASGLLAVALAAQTIRASEADVILAGGCESMSNAPYLLTWARGGYKLGHGELIDAILRDALVDSFHHEHMALTAERLAEQCGITRQQQDVFALQSQQRVAAAQRGGRFDDELVAVAGLDRDEHPRPDTTLDKLAALPAIFKAGGTVTAGNASGINDGAAMLLLAEEQTADRHGWPKLARIEAASTVGVDPRVMGLGPVHAIGQLCQRTNTKLADYDAIEINEAFAAQTLACTRELSISPESINACGSAIALGHPVGASGARLLVHLAHRLHRGEASRALASLCVGGGQGAAMTLARA